MKVNILTLFPDMFVPLKMSIIGRATEKEIINFNIVNIRDFATSKQKKADDYPFGGGSGMVMLPEPSFRALESVLGGREAQSEGFGGKSYKASIKGVKEGTVRRNLYMSPRGKMLDFEMAKALSEVDEITIFCGHYEGIDQRIIDEWQLEEVSIGNYIMTGGELAAMVLIDVVARLVDGVLPSQEAAVNESIYCGLLEAPQYTQPRTFEGIDVPEVLLSGNHKMIHLWRYEKALEITKEKRPDLFEKYLKTHDVLSKDELKVLEKVMK